MSALLRHTDMGTQVDSGWCKKTHKKLKLWKNIMIKGIKGRKIGEIYVFTSLVEILKKGLNCSFYCVFVSFIIIIVIFILRGQRVIFR